MSNTLYITIGTFVPLDQRFTSHDVITVLASDAYGTDYMTFDDIEHFKAVYPTEDDLIMGVLNLTAFDGGAIFNKTGSYELAGISSIVVQGYPE